MNSEDLIHESFPRPMSGDSAIDNTPVNRYAANLPPSPFTDVGNYNTGPARPTEIGPRKPKGSDKGRPPLRPGD